MTILIIMWGASRSAIQYKRSNKTEVMESNGIVQRSTQNTVM